MAAICTQIDGTHTICKNNILNRHQAVIFLFSYTSKFTLCTHAICTWFSLRSDPSKTLDGIIASICQPKPLPPLKSSSSESLTESAQLKPTQRRTCTRQRAPNSGKQYPRAKSGDKRKRSLEATLKILNERLLHQGRRPPWKRSRSSIEINDSTVGVTALPIQDQLPVADDMQASSPSSPHASSVDGKAGGSIVSTTSASSSGSTAKSNGKQKPLYISEKMEVCRYADELKSEGKFREAMIVCTCSWIGNV